MQFRLSMRAVAFLERSLRYFGYLVEWSNLPSVKSGFDGFRRFRCRRIGPAVQTFGLKVSAGRRLVLCLLFRQTLLSGRCPFAGILIHLPEPARSFLEEAGPEPPCSY